MKITGPIQRLVSARRSKDALDAALSAARRLVGPGGVAGGTVASAALGRAYRALSTAEAEAFLLALVDEFGPDHDRLAQAADAYLDRPSEPTASALHEGSQPVRQTLIRRLNMAPGGTELILGMRAAVLERLSVQPRLAPLEADLRHLLASWFNRGFLELVALDWQSPAVLLEKLIRYEAVHAISGWDDLRKRLSERRLCFAFVHPALPHEPLIFVEVALTGSISRRIEPLLGGESERDLPPTAAIFYSISNCQPGLRGIPLGNFLIKQLVTTLGSRWPSLTTFATLSPVPGFRRWLLDGPGRALAGPALRLQLETEGAGPPTDACERPLVRLCARYLSVSSAEADAVARFHLSNGARLERINWAANSMEKGLRESFGIMVNYAYRIPSMERNRARFLTGRGVACAPRVATQAQLRVT